MPNTMLRWIEQAEARRVTAEAQFRQTTPSPSWLDASCETVTDWFPMLRDWLCPTAESPLMRARPAPVRCGARRRACRRDAADYADWW